MARASREVAWTEAVGAIGDYSLGPGSSDRLAEFRIYAQQVIFEGAHE
ncbi:MAG: hypothetical protein P8Q97_13100 [Myxococcota bacterium]|jgi:hypothetical protein|nr:hypothetical protein [Myxococcota bacterium]